MDKREAKGVPRLVIAALGGFASRRELVSWGCDARFIDLQVWYRTILSVRKGWYASLGTDPLVLRALRAGGRLACVSAIAWHEGRQVPPDQPVHILVRHGASRLGKGAVVHWTRRTLEGTRLVVDEDVARWQAASCRGSASCRVRRWG